MTERRLTLLQKRIEAKGGTVLNLAQTGESRIKRLVANDVTHVLLSDDSDSNFDQISKYFCNIPNTRLTTRGIKLALPKIDETSLPAFPKDCKINRNVGQPRLTKKDDGLKKNDNDDKKGHQSDGGHDDVTLFAAVLGDEIARNSLGQQQELPSILWVTVKFLVDSLTQNCLIKDVAPYDLRHILRSFITESTVPTSQNVPTVPTSENIPTDEVPGGFEPVVELDSSQEDQNELASTQDITTEQFDSPPKIRNNESPLPQTGGRKTIFGNFIFLSRFVCPNR